MTPVELKAARATLGLTQDALARKLGITRIHVGHVEQGIENASEGLCSHLRLLVEVAKKGRP